jgi:hypothetical protein
MPQGVDNPLTKGGGGYAAGVVSYPTPWNIPFALAVRALVALRLPCLRERRLLRRGLFASAVSPPRQHAELLPVNSDR